VFRRLRVSGRNELVQRLFFADALGILEPAHENPIPSLSAHQNVATLEVARRSA
jgi:hypothetical protein